MKLTIKQEIVPISGGYHTTQWIVKDKSTSATLASTRTRKEARNFVRKHKEEHRVQP